MVSHPKITVSSFFWGHPGGCRKRPGMTWARRRMDGFCEGKSVFEMDDVNWGSSMTKRNPPTIHQHLSHWTVMKMSSTSHMLFGQIHWEFKFSLWWVRHLLCTKNWLMESAEVPDDFDDFWWPMCHGRFRLADRRVAWRERVYEARLSAARILVSNRDEEKR